MTDSAPKPPGQESGRKPGQPGSARDQALFSTLFATKPAKQRKLGPGLIAGLLHIPLLLLFFTSDAGERMLERAELLFLPVVLEEPPVTVKAPESAPPEAEPAPEPERERRRPDPPAAGAPAAPIVTPGQPDPTAVPVPGAGAPAVPPGIVPGEGAPRTILERLNAPPIDTRLVSPLNPGALVTGVETSRDRLAASIAAYNDSIMAEQTAASRARDWTRTDSEGRLWGARAGKIYVAGVALPIPMAMGAPPGRREGINART